VSSRKTCQVEFKAGKRVRLNLSPRKPLRNRLAALDAAAGAIPDSTPTTYTYDSNGSQITITQSASTTYHLWDLRNRMVGITLDNDGNATDPNETTYAYDSHAVRVSQITYATPANSAIVYLNDANNPTGYAKALEKKTGTSVSAAASSTPNTTYVLGLRVEGQKDSTSTVWFERDGHGSNRGLIETNGTVSASYDYNAFGDPIGFTLDSTTRTIELFGGDGVYDSATGWTYHLARWRNGFRFTSFDSYEGDSEDPQSLHKYLYVNANPINGIDPSGNSMRDILGWDTAADVQYDVNNADAFELAEIHYAYSALQIGIVDAIAEAMKDLIIRYYEGLMGLMLTMARTCFVAGTQVVVGIKEDGSFITRNIEDLRPGDMVVSRDEHDLNDNLDLRPVVQVFRKVSDHLRILRIQSQDTNVETLQTTDNHEFWVKGRRWVKAGDLRIGDQVDQPDGANATVISTVREERAEGISVYNFEVKGDHTYFVEDGNGNQTAIWVHNTASCVNSSGKRYPRIIDPRTGRPIPFPRGRLRVAPESQRVPWTSKERLAYQRKYESRYGVPRGGWDKYHIHHIKPKKYGGTNEFDNLVPVPKGPHQEEFTAWWNGF
jgi:hypothetical protein